jgi:biopolymer transport protein ExbB
VMSRQYAQAVQLCNQQETYPELAVIHSCLANVDAGREAMRSAVSETVLRLSQTCEKRLSYLALIASGATMLGLLGTISGLIKTFSGIATSDAAEKARLLGIGIAEAMNCTAAGLIIGVLAMVFHTICAARADRMVGQAQAAGFGLWTWIEQAERA